MTIEFSCERCGHTIKVPESMAGKHGHCKACGQETAVPGRGPEVATGPAAGFRLTPIDEDEPAVKASVTPPPPDAKARPRPGAALRSMTKDRASAGGHSGPAGIPEGMVADRAPYELDRAFEPPPSAVVPETSAAAMAIKAGWRHKVRSVTKSLAWMEDKVYLVAMLFWMLGAGAFLFELKPMAWTMAGLLLVCSVLLLFLGGFEIFVKPFQESLTQGLAVLLIPFYVFYYAATRWKVMKRPFNRALGAFGPLIVLIILALFSRPIRDWFLHAPPKKDGQQAVSAGPPVPGLRPFGAPPTGRPWI